MHGDHRSVAPLNWEAFCIVWREENEKWGCSVLPFFWCCAFMGMHRVCRSRWAVSSSLKYVAASSLNNQVSWFVSLFAARFLVKSLVWSLVGTRRVKMLVCFAFQQLCSQARYFYGACGPLPFYRFFARWTAKVKSRTIKKKKGRNPDSPGVLFQKL